MLLTQEIPNLITEETKLKNQEVTLPVLVSSMLIPSTLTTKYFITVVYGNGADNITVIASKLYNAVWLNPLSSYASIRNEINKLVQKNQNILASGGLLVKERKPFFEMLRVGIRSTGYVSTPKRKDDYDIGCPKIISTSDTSEQFWRKLDDIKDRFIIIPTDPENYLYTDYDYDYESLFKAREEFWLSAASKFEENLKLVEGTDRNLIATMATVYDIPMSEAIDKVSIYREFVEKYF